MDGGRGAVVVSGRTLGLGEAYQREQLARLRGEGDGLGGADKEDG
jgi:hypothetical protein